MKKVVPGIYIDWTDNIAIRYPNGGWELILDCSSNWLDYYDSDAWDKQSIDEEWKLIERF